MTDRTLQSDLLGLILGVGPGVLIGVVGLVLGGEWAWNLGFVAMWLILFGMFAGPLLGTVGPEIVAERPAVSGAVLGAVPGVVFTILRFADNGWLGLLTILVGSILGGFVGHWIATRSGPGQLPTGLTGGAV